MYEREGLQTQKLRRAPNSPVRKPLQAVASPGTFKVFGQKTSCKTESLLILASELSELVLEALHLDPQSEAHLICHAQESKPFHASIQLDFRVDRGVKGFGFRGLRG